MGGHQNFAAIKALMFDAVFDVGEHGLAYGEVGRQIQVQQARQHAAIAAGVEQEFGLEVVLAAVLAAYVQVTGFALEVHADDGFAIADFHALQRGLIGQQLVELAALYLEGGWLAVGEGVTEIKRAVALAPGERGAGFHLEPRGLHSVEHASFFNEVDAVGQQAFANREPWEMLALDDQYIMPFAL